MFWSDVKEEKLSTVIGSYQLPSLETPPITMNKNICDDYLKIVHNYSGKTNFNTFKPPNSREIGRLL